MKLSVITDCFNLSLEESLKKASLLGIGAVQIYATNGTFSPDMTDEEKNKVKEALAALGLKVSALCGDMGGYGFEIEADNPARIERTKEIIDLAVEFDTKVVTTHIGVIPADKCCAKYNAMLSALKECGKYASCKGVTLAIETGPENADVLKGFVEQIPEGVGVNLDPANFVMVTGQDPVEAVYKLSKYIVHTHLKDGVMLCKNCPEEVYHAFAVGGVKAFEACKGFKEVPLGEGSVKWKEYLTALNEIGFDGYLTIEREVGVDPEKEIADAVLFIKEKYHSTLNEQLQ